MPMDNKPLEQFVRSQFTPVYATSYQDIKEGLIEKHGRKNWIGAYAMTVSGASSKKDKEYKAARRSIERFEKGQFKTLKNYGTAPQLAKVGKTIPPVAHMPPGSIKITLRGMQGVREREWTVEFTGADAYRFSRNPSWKEFFKKRYPGTDFYKMADGADGDSGAVTVMAVY